MSIKVNGIDSYVGKVVYAHMPCIRIMSDVWENCPCVVVLDDDGSYKTIWTSYDENSVDASAEMIAEYHAKLAADRMAHDLAERKHNYLNSLNTFSYGKTVEVVRGRKVPIGTKGILFWMQAGQWGTKVGIALSNERDSRGRYSNVAWTYLANIKVVVSQADLDFVENMK